MSFIVLKCQNTTGTGESEIMVNIDHIAAIFPHPADNDKSIVTPGISGGSGTVVYHSFDELIKVMPFQEKIRLDSDGGFSREFTEIIRPGDFK